MLIKELTEAARRIHQDTKERLSRAVRDRDQLEAALEAKIAEYEQAQQMHYRSSRYKPEPVDNPPCPACFSIGVASALQAVPAGNDDRDVLRCVNCDFEVKGDG